MSEEEDKGMLSDHSSDRSSLARTKKMFRRMYVSDAGDQATVPPIMVQYLDSQKKVMKSRLMQGDTSSTSEETERTFSSFSDMTTLPGTAKETDRAPDSSSDIMTYTGTGKESEFSSSGPTTCESGPTTCESGPNQSMVTPREFIQDPFVTNRLVLARNALEDIYEDDQMNRDYQRKRRFLRMAYNLFHIDSMEEFCAASKINDEKLVIKKYENLLVTIECACNKWEKQKHEARLALKQQRIKDFADTGVTFLDSDVSTPCLSFSSVATDDEDKFDKSVPYPARSMYFYQKRANFYDLEWKYNLNSKSLSI